MEKEEIKQILSESQFIASLIMDAVTMAWRREWENANEELVSAEKDIKRLIDTYGFRFDYTLNAIKKALWATEIHRVYPTVDACTIAVMDLISELRENLKSENIKILDECLDRLAYMVVILSDAIEAGYKRKFDWCIREVQLAMENLEKLESIVGVKLLNARSDIDSMKFWAERKRPSKIDEKASSAINALFGEIREALK
jgi:hypothetical protein